MTAREYLVVDLALSIAELATVEAQLKAETSVDLAWRAGQIERRIGVLEWLQTHELPEDEGDDA